MLDVRRLRVLHAIHRDGSLAAAARALDYTQPAVGFHVRRLEAEVGTPLVVREGRGVRLTPAGVALAARAERLLADLADAEEEVAAIAGLRAGRIRLVGFPSGNAAVVPAALASLRTRHPGLRVTLTEAEPPDSVRAVTAGEADVALAFEYPGVAVDAAAGLHRRALGTDPLLAVLPAGHRFARGRRVELTALAEEVWIAGCPRCRGHLVHACGEAGFAPEIAYATDDHAAVQAMVAAGLGVALLPRMVLALHRREDVEVRPLREEPIRELTAVAAAGAASIPSVAATLDALEASAARLAA